MTDRKRLRADHSPAVAVLLVIGIYLTLAALHGLCVFGWFGADDTADKPFAEPRSSQWPKVRAAYLADHPECAACGSRGSRDKPLQVHHVIPFHVAGQADADGDGISNELDPDNLITLCTDGVGHTNCHLMIGHAGNFRCSNPNCRRDAARFREMLKHRVCGTAER